MGKEWDGTKIAYSVDLWREVLRVLKPGGHLAAFGGTRTYHRMAVAIEDAGFEIRDSLHWVYGSGFPKSLDVSKAIDKAGGDTGQRLFRSELRRAIADSGLTFSDIDRALGVKSTSCYWVRSDHRACLPARHHWMMLNDLLNLSGDLSALYVECEREVVGSVTKGSSPLPNNHDGHWNDGQVDGTFNITTPATDAAKQWEGWGTALKPAHEPIVLARKPLIGTVASNVLEWGTGALNIDRTRVDAGRWPANVIFDTEAGAVLDEQSGVSNGRVGMTQHGSGTNSVYGTFTRSEQSVGNGGTPDRGGASRFFTSIDWNPEIDVPFRYVPKPGKRERNAGLDGLPAKFAPTMNDGIGGKPHNPETATPKQNHHPTVKPLALMRWLVRLVTPPGGTVLEPFAGSGTTLMAATLEGFTSIGIEMTDEYLPIIEGRVRWAQAQPPEAEQETLPL